MFIMSQCFPFMVARVFILGYQAGFYLEGGKRLLEAVDPFFPEQPASSLLVIISSWWRGYYLLLVLTKWVGLLGRPQIDFDPVLAKGSVVPLPSTWLGIKQDLKNENLRTENNCNQTVSSSTWVAIEREISLYYIYDYEHEQRWWVPISIIILAVIICSLGTTCYTFGGYLIPYTVLCFQNGWQYFPWLLFMWPLHWWEWR